MLIFVSQLHGRTHADVKWRPLFRRRSCKTTFSSWKISLSAVRTLMLAVPVSTGMNFLFPAVVANAGTRVVSDGRIIFPAGFRKPTSITSPMGCHLWQFKSSGSKLLSFSHIANGACNIHLAQEVASATVFLYRLMSVGIRFLS
jgi:hypothetical protein